MGKNWFIEKKKYKFVIYIRIYMIVINFNS